MSVAPAPPSPTRSTSGACAARMVCCGEFNAAGVLSAADVHVASRLAAIAGEHDESVMLAAALAVRAPRLAHVHVDLATIRETAAVDTDEPVDVSSLPWPDPASWMQAAGREPARRCRGRGRRRARPLRLRRQRAVPGPLLGPRSASSRVDLRGDGRGNDPGVRIDLLRRGARAAVRRADRHAASALAAASAVLRRFAVVAGGPGTGKTTTVARIVALLAEQAAAAGSPLPLIALAAPTGKAAARLEEAVHEEAARLDVELRGPRAAAGGLQASTLHRLLGWRPGQPQPLPPRPRQSAPPRRRDRRRDLDGVAVADGEAARGAAARRAAGAGRRPGAARLDRGRRGARRHRRAGRRPADDQRAVGRRCSSGSPAIACSRPIRPGCRGGRRDRRARPRAPLRRGDRALAAAIRGGDADDVLRRAARPARRRRLDPGRCRRSERRADALAPVRERAVAAGRGGDRGGPRRRRRARRSMRSARSGSCARTAAALKAWRPGRRGSRPGSRLLGRVHGRGSLVRRPPAARHRERLRAAAVQRRHRRDRRVRRAGRVSAAFERGGEIVELSPTRLESIDTVYAMTIHKSQGSQFDTAAVLLPDARLADPHPRAALHGRDPRTATADPGRHRGHDPGRRGAARRARVGAANAALGPRVKSQFHARNNCATQAF